jgi:hypothetical protein
LVLRSQDVNAMAHPETRPGTKLYDGNVVDFDEAFLEARPEAERRNLLVEAELLARAFAPERRREELQAMAATLMAGARDDEVGRMHARRLAAALRHLGRKMGDYP